MGELSKGQIATYVAVVLLAVLAGARLLAGGDGAAQEPPPVAVDGGAPGLPGDSAPPPATPGEPAATGGAAAPSGVLTVHVAGAVDEPGLYTIPAGSRVAAAIDAAGGLSRRAESAGVNLAAPLQDGQQVIVPRRGTAQPGAPGQAGAAGAGAPGAGQPVSLSQATVEQLETLDGIGPALAQRIIEYREEHGGFRSLEELKEVEGIGDKRYESLSTEVVP